MMLTALAMTLAALAVPAGSIAAEKNGPPSSRQAGEESAVDAERAFAADAQRLGQWTAFRKWAIADDAVMFTPQPVDAQIWLKNRKDPPASVRWQPIASYISCDGGTAVNTGAWQGAGETKGFFTTVWSRQREGTWRWELDHGDDLPTARPIPASPAVRRATCGGSIPFDAPMVVPDGGRVGWTGSRDGSLRVKWWVTRDGGRTVQVSLWNGSDFDEVIRDEVAAPPPTVVPQP